MIVPGALQWASVGQSDWYSVRMAIQMTATQLKAKILSVLDDVAAGDEVEITKHGRTIARLVPARGPAALKGALVGVAMTAASDESLYSTGEHWGAS